MREACESRGKQILAMSPHLEYGDPGVGDVVEVDRALVRVVISGPTDVVVLVPVHAAVPAGRHRCRRRRGQAPGRGVQRALGPARPTGGGDVVATEHAVLSGGRADEGALLAFLRHVVGTDGQVVHPVVVGRGGAGTHNRRISVRATSHNP